MPQVLFRYMEKFQFVLFDSSIYGSSGKLTRGIAG